LRRRLISGLAVRQISIYNELSMAFYLKYRPQKITELDLDSVRQSLGEILASQNIPHAFLFVGPKGTGKTSSARIVAKSLNCLKKTKGRKGEPCGKCDMCQAITKGTAMDLIEIDAASNRGIDDIRDLRQKIKLAPSRAKFKTYIIDEAHMLTREAFNALLKTLEEPPAHAVFVLCTTEPEKLPGTIVSRCWRVEFNKAKPKEIVRSMKKIVKGEKLKIGEKDLLKIAQQVDGSFRDAAKILELSATIGKRISSKRVIEVLSQGAGEFNLDEWLVMVYQQEIKVALDWLGQASAKGVDPIRLIKETLERLRQVLLARLGVEAKDKDISELTDVIKVRQLMELLIKAGSQIKGAVIEVLPLELAIMEWAEIESGIEIETETESEIESETEKMSQVKVKENEDKGSKVKAEVQAEPAVAVKLSSKRGKLKIEAIKAKWSKVLEAIRPQNYSLEALLRATKPTGFEGKFLVLEVFYKFHKERLEVDRYRQQVEAVASEVLEEPVNIRYCLSQRNKEKLIVKEQPGNVSVEVGDDVVKTAEEVFGVNIN